MTKVLCKIFLIFIEYYFKFPLLNTHKYFFISNHLIHPRVNDVTIVSLKTRVYSFFLFFLEFFPSPTPSSVFVINIYTYWGKQEKKYTRHSSCALDNVIISCLYLLFGPSKWQAVTVSSRVAVTFRL